MPGSKCLAQVAVCILGGLVPSLAASAQTMTDMPAVQSVASLSNFWEAQVRPWLGATWVAVLLMLIFGNLWIRHRRRVFILKHGVPGTARVKQVRPTGWRSGNDPVLRLDCWVQPQDGPGYEGRTKKLFSFMDAPFVRPGVSFRVRIHPKKSKYFEIARQAASPDGADSATERGPSSPNGSAGQVSVARIQKRSTIGPAAGLETVVSSGVSAAIQSATGLRERGVLAVCTILGIASAANGACTYTIEIDQINKRRQTVTVTQLFKGGNPYSAGDRAYLLLDPQKPENSVLMSLDMTGGQKLPRIGNRLDSYVLANEILSEGSKAQGTVIAAERQTLDPMLERRGLSKWLIRMRVVPEHEDPAYDGEMTIGVTTQEKAAVISRIGAVLPVRYNSYDPQTLAIDTVALGFGDPRAAENAGGQL